MPVKPSTRLFIGGIKRSVDKDELTGEFGKYGSIVDVWIAYDPAGFAFVEFSTVEEAKKALEAKHKTICFGSEVRVEYTQRKEEKDENSDDKPRLFIGNIKTAIEKENLSAVFEQYGSVTDVWIAHNPPGFAFVQYDTMEEAQRAVDACDGQEHFGGPIKVQITNGKKDGRRKRFKDRRVEWQNNNRRPFGRRYPYHGNARQAPYARGHNAARGNYNSYYDESYYPQPPPPHHTRGGRARSHYRGGRGGGAGGYGPPPPPPPPAAAHGAEYHDEGYGDPSGYYQWDRSQQQDMGYNEYQDPNYQDHSYQEHGYSDQGYSEQGYQGSYDMSGYDASYYEHDMYAGSYY